MQEYTSGKPEAQVLRGWNTRKIYPKWPTFIYPHLSLGMRWFWHPLVGAIGWHQHVQRLPNILMNMNNFPLLLWPPHTNYAFWKDLKEGVSCSRTSLWQLERWGFLPSMEDSDIEFLACMIIFMHLHLCTYTYIVIYGYIYIYLYICDYVYLYIKVYRKNLYVLYYI